MTDAAVTHIGESRFVLCHDCGAAQPVVPLQRRLHLRCDRCGRVIAAGHGRWLPLATALTATALILFLITHSFTFITLELAGSTTTATIFSGVGALLDRSQWILAPGTYTVRVGFNAADLPREVTFELE